MFAEVQNSPFLIIGFLNNSSSTVLQASYILYTRIYRTHAQVVPGATHLFEEEGCLERVAELARDWFVEKFSAAAAAR